MSVRAAVHYFDTEERKWKPADKGISSVEIYKIGPLDNDISSFLYKIVAVSVESHEVVVNTQINSSSFNPKKVEARFVQWTDESSLIIGLNFASQQELSSFEKEVDAILSEYRNGKQINNLRAYSFYIGSNVKEMKKMSRKSCRKSMRSTQNIVTVPPSSKITFTQEDLTKKLDERKNVKRKKENSPNFILFP